MGNYGENNNYGDSFYKDKNSSFVGSPTDGIVSLDSPLSVEFNVTGYNGSDTGFWNFGDGSETGFGLTGVLHDYSYPGSFSVELTIPSVANPVIIEIPDYITTLSSLDFQANPLFNIIDPPSSVNVSFNITGDQGATEWYWDYGDGDQYSTDNSSLKSPPHNYLQEGFFDVTLKLNDDENWELTKEGYILIVEKLDLDIDVSPSYWYGSLPKDFDLSVINANRILDAEPSGGYPGFTWNLDNGDIITGETGITDYSGYSSYDTYQIELSLRDIGVSGVASTRQSANFTKILVIGNISISVNPNDIKINNTVSFNITFLGDLPSNIKVDYGDGTDSGVLPIFSSPFSIDHLYTTAGKYNESGPTPLKLTLNVGEDDEQSFVRIPGDPTLDDFYVNVSNINAEFSVEPIQGYLPLTGLFLDQSVGSLTGWEWDFGDGSTPVLQETGLSHVYDTAGTYYPLLTIWDIFGFSDTNSEEVIVLPSLDIDINPSPDEVTQTLNFSPINDTYAVLWEWEIIYDDPSLGEVVIDFKTTSDSGDKNFSKEFYAPTAYKVKLTITDNLSNKYSTEKEFNLSENIQIVTDPVPPSGVVPLTVLFDTLNLDTDNVDEFSWDFNTDGTPDSSDLEVSHTFNQVGIFLTTLTITWYLSSGGTLKYTLTKSVSVNVGSLSLSVDFTRSPSIGRKPLSVDFSGISNNPINNWEWVLEDVGVIGTTKDISYNFTEEGYYLITLNVTDVFGDTANISKSIEVVDKFTTFDVAVKPSILEAYRAKLNGSGNINVIPFGGVMLSISSSSENPDPSGFKREKGPTIIFD